jgi:hypothetical protein
MEDLEHWESFYLITGGAAGALIGLQFVVMTLLAERPSRGIRETSPAFSTPTIAHFSLCLLLSALIRVPWPRALLAAWAWGVAGLSGLIYTIIVTRRVLAQQSYQPDAEDWIFHVIGPLAAYLTAICSAIWAQTDEGQALFAVGAATLALLFIGIHNSWDVVLFVSSGQYQANVHDPQNQSPPQEEKPR